MKTHTCVDTTSIVDNVNYSSTSKEGTKTFTLVHLPSASIWLDRIPKVVNHRKWANQSTVALAYHTVHKPLAYRNMCGHDSQVDNVDYQSGIDTV